MHVWLKWEKRHKEIKILQTKYLGSIQLSKAKKQLIGQLAMSQENHEDLMLTLGKSFLVYNRMEGLDSITNQLNAITPMQLSESANEVLDPDKLSVLTFI